MISRQQTAELLGDTQIPGTPGRRLNVFLIVLIVFNVIAVVLESVAEISLAWRSQFIAFEVFSVAVFTIEYLARVWSSIDLAETADSSPIIGRLKYMLTPIAIVDLIAILPFFLGFWVSLDLRFLRGLRLLRLLKLTRYSPALGAIMDVVQKESEALLAAFVVLLIMLAISAGGIYLLEGDLQPEVFGSIPDSMWWAIVTLTTVGYGDVVPVTPGGKLFAGVIGLIGIGMIALPAAIMASGFADYIHRRKAKYSRHVEQMLKDGVIDEGDRWRLEDIRRDLGMDSDEALELLHRELQEAREQAAASCPHCGKRLK